MANSKGKNSLSKVINGAMKGKLTIGATRGQVDSRKREKSLIGKKSSRE